MKRLLFLLWAVVPALLFAQYPLETYTELPDFTPIDRAEWDRQPEGLLAAWASVDVRYPKNDVPDVRPSRKALALSGWKGEKLNAQLVLWSRDGQADIRLEASDLQGPGGAVIPSERVETHFVRYVMTDEFGQSGCGHRPDKTQFDSLLVADVLDFADSFRLEARTVCPVWMTVKVPQDVAQGVYKGTVRVWCGDTEQAALPFSVRVGRRTLPEPSEWSFHLDLWQNPYAVARYYGTPLWSEAHFEAMRPLMKALADAGQKVITASIMHKPWNGQTYDYFDSMITWMKKYDGTWEFRYDVFDAWVEFMMSLGIDRQINCYSMVPWSLSFQYFDQKTNRMQVLHSQPGEKEYDEVWTALLTDFARHLKEKGWFDKTCIAMDERPLPAMKQVLSLIRRADKDFKLSLAGLYYEEIEPDMYDYCLSPDQHMPLSVIERRRAEQKVSTYYTCCTDSRPNTFTFSPPAEAAWIGLYAARLHMDGYLRWAYNSWVEYPLQDSRFITWAGGDTYLVYPGFRSSIRFERLIEGIQQYEKVALLRAEYEKNGNRAGLKKLDRLVECFDLERLKAGADAGSAVRRAEEQLNRL